jgi:hypothetical protein
MALVHFIFSFPMEAKIPDLRTQKLEQANIVYYSDSGFL